MRCATVRVSAVHWALPLTSDSIGLILISSVNAVSVAQQRGAPGH